MKYYKINSIILPMALLQLFSVTTATGYTFLSPRSQSVNAARELVGWQQCINILSDDCCYGAFSATAQYCQSYNYKQLAKYFFSCPTLVFSGSQVAARDEHDILADYFGLPTDFKSTVTFKPKIRNFLVDFDWYIGFDTFCPGSYFRIHAPLVYAAWDMHLCESIENAGTNEFPPGYMANSALERSSLEKSVTQALCRCRTIGDIQPLTAGRICCGKRTKTNISEVQIAIGHNPIVSDTSHFGWNIRTSIPTGGRSRGDFLFEPVIGNGGHWEFGFGLTGHDTFRINECNTLSLYADLNVTHLFKARQRRSFDLCRNGCLSRYMLLEQMSTPLVFGLGSNAGNPPVEIAAEQQYSGKLIPAVNQTTLYADISVAVQADFAIKLAYTYKHFSLDIGYDAWIRSREKIHCRQPFPDNSFAVKGDAQIYGFGLDPEFFVALNATEHLATIHAGQGTGNSDFTNNNVDNAGPAVFDSTPLFTGDRITAVDGSAEAILLSDDDINEASGVSPKAISHTFFMHSSYDWRDCNGIAPFVGAGIFVETNGHTAHQIATALSQWGIWFKIGVCV